MSNHSVSIREIRVWSIAIKSCVLRIDVAESNLEVRANFTQTEIMRVRGRG